MANSLTLQNRLRVEPLLLGVLLIMCPSFSHADCTPPKKGIFGAFGGTEQEDTNSIPCVPEAKSATKDRAVAEVKEPQCNNKKLAKVEFFKFCKTQIFVTRFEQEKFSGSSSNKDFKAEDEDFCRCLAEKSPVEAFADDSKCQFKSRYDLSLIRTLTDDEIRYDCRTIPSFLKN